MCIRRSACRSRIIHTSSAGSRMSKNCHAGRKRKARSTGRCGSIDWTGHRAPSGARGDAGTHVMTSGGTVRSIFNYTRDTDVEPEIYFYEPPHGAEPRRPGDDPREMTVHNGWDRATLFSLDREGFALRDFRSLFQQWDDDSAIRERFYGEAAEFVRIEVGATRLMIFDHTIRAKKKRAAADR